MDNSQIDRTAKEHPSFHFRTEILLVPRLIDRSISRRRKGPFGKLLKFLSAISRASPADGIKGRWGGRARIKRGVVARGIYTRREARLVKGPTRKSRFVPAIVKCPRPRILKALSPCTLSYDVLSLPQGTFHPSPPSFTDYLSTECLSQPEDIFCSELVVRRKLCVVLFDIWRTNVLPSFLPRPFSCFPQDSYDRATSSFNRDT